MNPQNLKQASVAINDKNNGKHGEGDKNGSTIKFEAKVIKANLCEHMLICS